MLAYIHHTKMFSLPDCMMIKWCMCNRCKICVGWTLFVVVTCCYVLILLWNVMILHDCFFSFLQSERFRTVHVLQEDIHFSLNKQIYIYKFIYVYMYIYIKQPYIYHNSIHSLRTSFNLTVFFACWKFFWVDACHLDKHQLIFEVAINPPLRG